MFEGQNSPWIMVLGRRVRLLEEQKILARRLVRVTAQAARAADATCLQKLIRPRLAARVRQKWRLRSAGFIEHRAGTEVFEHDRQSRAIIQPDDQVFEL